MIEKMSFETSGLVKNKDDKMEIEFWGHDAGEYFYEEVLELMKEVKIDETSPVGTTGSLGSVEVRG